jgi:hypothetical protein
MRDEDDSHLGTPPHRVQLLLHLLARQGIERAERLVHQQDLGVVDERANYGEALLHAARELIGVTVAEIPEANEAKIMLYLFSPRAAEPTHHRTEAGILDDAHPGKERWLLEDDAAVGTRASDRLASECHASPRGPDEAG